MTDTVSVYPTDLHVASQSAHDLVVVDPPYAIFSTTFIVVGILVVLLGIFLLIQFRVGFGRPLQVILWLLPFLIAAPFLTTGAFTGRTTHITLSAESNTLNVQKTFLSMPLGSKEYSLADVRLVKVGVGNVCRFLYVSLADRPAENLTSCTDRTGYSEVADAMNAFLDANRRATSTPDGPQKISSSIP